MKIQKIEHANKFSDLNININDIITPSTIQAFQNASIAIKNFDAIYKENIKFFSKSLKEINIPIIDYSKFNNLAYTNMAKLLKEHIGSQQFYYEDIAKLINQNSNSIKKFTENYQKTLLSLANSLSEQQKLVFRDRFEELIKSNTQLLDQLESPHNSNGNTYKSYSDTKNGNRHKEYNKRVQQNTPHATPPLSENQIWLMIKTIFNLINILSTIDNGIALAEKLINFLKDFLE